MPKWKVIVTITLNRPARRHPDRHPAGRRPHRRDRATAVHRAVNQFWSVRHERPDGKPAGGDFKFAMSPLRELAEAGLGAGVFPITDGRAGAQHVARRDARSARPVDGRTDDGCRRPRPPVASSQEVKVRNLNFYYGGFHALKNINLENPDKKVTAFIGPGCGKSTCCATFNRMLSSTPSSAPRARSCWTARTS